jgi:hypothetical protein
MSWGGPSFVLAIIALVILGKFLNNWLRMRHGFAPEESSKSKGGQPNLTDQRQLTLLGSENAELKGKIVRLEERVAVLERIATDKGTRLSDEIEALR